nr:hypothetical protein [Tanacetum cinerariifolium]
MGGGALRRNSGISAPRGLLPLHSRSGGPPQPGLRAAAGPAHGTAPVPHAAVDASSSPGVVTQPLPRSLSWTRSQWFWRNGHRTVGSCRCGRCAWPAKRGIGARRTVSKDCETGCLHCAARGAGGGCLHCAARGAGGNSH